MGTKYPDGVVALTMDSHLAWAQLLWDTVTQDLERRTLRRRSARGESKAAQLVQGAAWSNPPLEASRTASGRSPRSEAAYGRQSGASTFTACPHVRGSDTLPAHAVTR